MKFTFILLLLLASKFAYSDNQVQMMHEGYTAELSSDSRDYLLLLEFAETSNKALIELLEENLLTKEDSLFYALGGLSDDELGTSICEGQKQGLDNIKTFKHLYQKDALLEIFDKVIEACSSKGWP